jgi:hypothetical protein
MKAVIMALVDGMFAEFEVVSNVSAKDGKTYLNILTATPITQLRDDVPAVQPIGQSKAEVPAGDTRVRSMALAYVKDLIVAGKVDLLAWRTTAIEFELYILMGE